jgi:hypothetical protein
VLKSCAIYMRVMQWNERISEEALH